MTDSQARAAYRLAVEATLVRFYRQAPERARTLTDTWWEELKTLRVFKSGLLMHTEPMNTAGEIAGLPVLAIDDEIRVEYLAMLEDSVAAVPEARGPMNQPGEIAGHRELGAA